MDFMTMRLKKHFTNIVIRHLNQQLEAEEMPQRAISFLVNHHVIEKGFSLS
jgi:hypothetical protein